MLPFRLLPRPSLLTGAVVAMSVTTGLALGALAGGALILVASVRDASVRDASVRRA